MQHIGIIGGIIVGTAVVGGAVWWFVRRRGSSAKGGAKAALATSLRDEKARSDIILNTIEDGVVFVDGQGTIQLFNPGAAIITGWNRGDATGLDWKSVFTFINNKGETVAETDTPFARALAGAQSVRDNNASIAAKSGKTIAVSFSVSPIVSAPADKAGNPDETETVKGGEVTGLVGIFRDVSAERQEESQRGEFISTASHEMRTPVAAIEGYLSLALNEKVATIDARAKDFLEKAHAATKHLGELFQDLLTSAKAEDGRLTNHPDVVEMGDFMEQLSSDLHFAAEKKSLGMEFLIGSNTVASNAVIDASTPGSGLHPGSDRVVRPLYYVQVDPDRLREVITNLFDNACKYTEKGKISLGLTGNDDVVQLYVRDTGHGIPPEDIPHLFQKFYRVDNSATRTIGGTGLGLFICRKIVELYRGRIWVESTLGQGSTFYINLPRLSTDQAEQLQAQLAAAAAQKVGALQTDQVLQPAAVPAPIAAAPPATPVSAPVPPPAAPAAPPAPPAATGIAQPAAPPTPPAPTPTPAVSAVSAVSSAPPAPPVPQAPAVPPAPPA